MDVELDLPIQWRSWQRLWHILQLRKGPGCTVLRPKKELRKRPAAAILPKVRQMFRRGHERVLICIAMAISSTL